MGISARQGAGALDAIREAIQMYMGLRQQKFDRERQLSSDERAQRQLDLAEQRGQRDIAHTDYEEDESKKSAERKQLEFMVANYGGHDIDLATAGRAKELGYGMAVEPKMTLPSSQPAMPITGMNSAQSMSPDGQMGGAASQPLSSPMSTIARYSPAQETGEYRLAMPESERARIAAFNAQTRAYEGAQNRTNRIETTNITANASMKRAELQAEIARAAQSLGRYRADLGSLDRQRALVQQATQFASLLDDRDIDNATQRLRANPMAVLDFIQGNVSAPGAISRPGGTGIPYYTPGMSPNMGGTSAPNPGSSRFTEIP